jgi:RNA polymerase sigma factor (sigma-70 family)
MATPTEPLLRYLRRLSVSSADNASDTVLVERFGSQGDESAFTALLARHGPMVHGVCRRILRDAHDAEDAFQATFLVMARKARSLRRPEALASWLYGTARHLASRVRRADCRRRQRETCCRQSPSPPSQGDVLDDLSARELLLALDEEIQRLPEAYRLPLILCHLEGYTHEEAARLLGWTVGSVRGRLERGRKQLQGRLCRRGLTLGASLLALESTATATVSAALRQATVQRALAFAAGWREGIAASVLALAESAATSMTMAKMKLGLIVLLALGLATGTGVLAYPLRNEKPPEARQAETPKSPESISVKQEPTDPDGDPLPVGAVARLGSARLRHGGIVNAVAYSPDGKLLVSGCDDYLIRIWDARTGKKLRQLIGHTSWPFALAFSPDGRTLASGANDSTVRLWEVATGRLVWTITEKGAISSVAFCSDGKTLAAGCWDCRVRLLDTATGTCLRTFERHAARVMTLALSPDDRLLASGSWEDKRICLWNVETGKLVRELGKRKHEVGATRFSPDGKTLATGGIDGPIHLWDVATGQEVRQLVGHPSFVEKLIFTKDGKTLISASYDKTVRVWDVAGGRQSRLLGTHLHYVYGLALSPDETTVASSGQDNLVRRWDLASGKEIRLPGHEHTVTSVRFSSDGKNLITGAKDGTVRVWELATGKELRRHSAIPDRTSPALTTMSADGRTLAVAGADCKVYLRDLTSGKELASLKADADVTALRFSLDGKVLACGTSANTIYLWDAGTGKELGRLKGYADEVARLTFSPDGKLVAAGGSGGHGTRIGTISLWEVATGKEVRRIEGGFLPLCFSPDGRMLATWQANDVKNGIARKNHLAVWELATGRERATMPESGSVISAAAFSPDGLTIAQACWDQSIQVWDMLTGRQRHRFQSDQGRIEALSFSADGSRLASAGQNTTTLVWDVRERSPRQPNKSRELSTKELKHLWDELVATDAARAFKAMTKLHTEPGQIVQLLRSHLRPISVVDAQRVKRLLADLDADAFAVREKATKELMELGDSVEQLLRQALRETLSPEARRRVRSLLEKRAASPERLRTLRALEVLEWLNTRESRQLLHLLGHGAPGVWLTREANAALARLAARPATHP